MDEDNKDSRDAGETWRSRRRAPPTIEASATDVTPPAGAADAGAEANPAAAPETAENANPENGLEPAASSDRRRSAWWPMGAVGTGLVAAAAGAGAAAGILVYAFAIAPNDDDVAGRLSRAESRLAELSARPTTPAATRKDIDDIAARIAKVEQALADTRRTGAASADVPLDRLAALEALTKGLTQRAADLARRADDFDQTLRGIKERLDATTTALADVGRGGDAKTLADIDTRIAAVDAAVKDARAAIANVAAPPALKAVRLAVVAQALEAAVNRGAPFATELDGARALGADQAALAELAPFAATGLPAGAALAAELSALAPKLSAALPATASDNSFVGRLQANAEKLVRVRPASDAKGDDGASVIARMEARAARGDIAGALAEAPKLPGETRALADGWIKRAEAHEKARAAAARLATSALAAVAH